MVATLTGMKRKVCLVGDEGVGKTSIVRRFAHAAFDEGYMRTVGTMVSKRDMNVPEMGHIVTLLIWDISGQRDFVDLFKEAYFKHIRGIVPVFDLTRPETFESLHEWLGETVASAPQVPMTVLANKADLTGERRIADSQVKGFCSPRSISWMKTSARTGQNVETAFHHLAGEMARR